MAPHENSRNPAIDALRGMSILVVIATHGAMPAGMFWPLSRPQLAFLGNGTYGVAVFFVISGFLIANNTLRRYGRLSAMSPLEFYAMRVGRIMPVLLLFLTTFCTLSLILKLDHFVPEDPRLVWGSIWHALVFQYNTYYLVANVPGLQAFAPLWSLSIEETFYLVFPLACLMLRRTWIIMAVLVALIVYAPFVRGEWAGVYLLTGNADLLSLGILSAIAANRLQPELIDRYRRTLLWTGASIMAIVYLLTDIRQHYTLAHTVIGSGAALYLLGASNTMQCRFGRTSSALAMFGRASYEIYVFHVTLLIATKPVGVWIGRALSDVEATPRLAPMLYGLTMLVLLGGCGTLLNRVYGEPLNREIRRWSQRFLSPSPAADDVIQIGTPSLPKVHD